MIKETVYLELLDLPSTIAYLSYCNFTDSSSAAIAVRTFPLTLLILLGRARQNIRTATIAEAILAATSGLAIQARGLSTGLRAPVSTSPDIGHHGLLVFAKGVTGEVLSTAASTYNLNSVVKSSVKLVDRQPTKSFSLHIDRNFS